MKKISERALEERFIEFLRAICSVGENGVQSKQEYINSLIFGEKAADFRRFNVPEEVSGAHRHNSAANTPVSPIKRRHKRDSMRARATSRTQCLTHEDLSIITDTNHVVNPDEEVGKPDKLDSPDNFIYVSTTFIHRCFLPTRCTVDCDIEIFAAMVGHQEGCLATNLTANMSEGSGITPTSPNSSNLWRGRAKKHTRQMVNNMPVKQMMNITVQTDGSDGSHGSQPNTPTSRASHLDDLTPTAQEHWMSLQQFCQKEQQCKYLVSTILLFKAMCVGRNYVCIDAIKGVFPEQAVLNAVKNCLLPEQLRAALCQLLVVVYVDVKPQDHVLVPTYSREWGTQQAGASDLSLLTESMDIESAEDIRIEAEKTQKLQEFFAEIRDFMLVYLEENTVQYQYGTAVMSKNKLTMAMLKLCSNMIDFGLWLPTQSAEKSQPTAIQLERLVIACIKMLDGSTDRLFPEFDQCDDHLTVMGSELDDMNTKPLLERNHSAEPLLGSPMGQDDLSPMKDSSPMSPMTPARSLDFHKSWSPRTEETSVQMMDIEGLNHRRYSCDDTSIVQMKCKVIRCLTLLQAVSSALHVYHIE